MALNYKDIKIGDEFSFEHFIDEDAVNKFAALTGDFNPLHVDQKYAEKTEFGGRISHGMLLASLFSTLVGMHLPGERALYISQDSRFRSPLPLNTKVKVEGKVTARFDALSMIELQTIIKDEKGKVVVDGVARVKVRQ